MSSSWLEPHPTVDNIRYRKATLATMLVGALAGAVSESVALGDGSTSNFIRLILYMLVAGTSTYELLHRQRTEAPLALIAGSFGLLTLYEGATMTGVDTGITLGVFVMISVLFVITREGTDAMPVAVVSLSLSIYTVALMLIERNSLSESIVMFLLGVPGQTLVLWITWRMLRSLAFSHHSQSRQARIQEALATCSHALLTGRDPEPLAAALKALLEATEADYIYVDVNRAQADGGTGWEIVADAYGDNIPAGPDTFDDGDYSQFPEVADRLSRGQPARISVTDLPMPIRGVYEAEGIRSELIAPITIRGQWVGSVGYVDFWRDDEWGDMELVALTRAADMIAAYWERESAREGLEELAKAKDRFIATVSHELRTPLAAVVGFADSLAEGLETFTSTEIAEMVGLIAGQGREVSQLVDDLLTAERAASGNLTIQAADIDLAEETIAVLHALSLQGVVHLEGQGVKAWADTLRTRQIVRNLLTNATRYGGETVKVEVANGGSVAFLAVVDSGPGVKGMDAEHIFDPYYRSQVGGGGQDSVGLGLAVARQLARMMNGDLVYRRRDGWTRFELTLPSPVGAEAAVSD